MRRTRPAPRSATLRAMSEQEAQGRVALVFDGECGFCTRAVGWVRRLDRRGRVVAYPAQRPGVLGRFGIGEAQAREAAWAVGPGVRASGAGAAAAVLDAALGVRLFASAYRLPGIRHVADGAYAWVARHRGRLRGVTPWCLAHPGDCGPAAGPGCSR